MTISSAVPFPSAPHRRGLPLPVPAARVPRLRGARPSVRVSRRSTIAKPAAKGYRIEAGGAESISARGLGNTCRQNDPTLGGSMKTGKLLLLGLLLAAGAGTQR